VKVFYHLADERSRQFVENVTAQMKKENTRAAVIVTGGFHTEKVMEMLRKQGVTCLTVRPRMTQEDLVNPYFSLVRNRKTPLEKLLAQNQNILALAPRTMQSENRGIVTVAEENAAPQQVQTFLQMVRAALQEQAVLEDVAAGAKDVAALRKGQPANYPYADRLTIDWDNAVGKDGVFILPFKEAPMSAVVRLKGAKTEAGRELSRLEEGSYELVAFDQETVNATREQILASGRAVRGLALRGELLSQIAPWPCWPRAGRPWRSARPA